MKKIITNFLIISALAGMFSALVTAEEYEHPITSPLSETTLKVLGLAYQIEFIGVEGSSIILQTDDIEPLPEKAKGMRSLLSTGKDTTGLGLELLASEEEANTLVLRQVRNLPGRHLRIEVPKAMAIHVEAHMNESIYLEKLEGEITAKTINGGIEIVDATGPLVLSSTNGQINATISELNQEYPSSISAINGEIDLGLKAKENASFDLTVVHGEIYTDMDLEIEKKSQPMYQISGPREMKATLNGGGVNMKVSTVNGQIYIRKIM